MSGDNRNKIENRVFRKNLETFMLLTTYHEFQDAIRPIREQIKAAHEQLENNKISVADYGLLCAEFNWSLHKRFNLPFNFRSALSIYLQNGEISEKEIPSCNYEFRFRPLPEIKRNGEPVDRVWEVHLITFSRLTEEELEAATKSLKRIQAKMFPKTKLFKRTKVHIHIERELEIERRGLERKPAGTEEEFLDHWLILQEKKFNAGEISQEEFNEFKRLNKQNIRKIKEPSYTARKIAKELKMEVAPDTLRQTIKRIKKERLDRFIG